jgi:putative transposase
MQYRRAFVPGGAFFFTVVTAGRAPLFADKANIAVLQSAFRRVRFQRPFLLKAVVVLPDHLHCIWTLPPHDGDFSTRWRLIKTWFTKHCDSASQGRANKITIGESSLWQPRYWEHVLRDEADLRRHIEYIHFNPVKHGYVKAPIDWPYSSFHRYVKAGVYPPDWGAADVDFMPSVGNDRGVSGYAHANPTYGLRSK